MYWLILPAGHEWHSGNADDVDSFVQDKDIK